MIAILPLPVEDYINDFGPTDDFRIDGQGAELRKEFKYWLSRKAIEIITMPVSPTRKAAYLKAGYFVADNIDIMIAIWNGNEKGGDSITDRIGLGQSCSINPSVIFGQMISKYRIYEAVSPTNAD